MAWMSVLPLLFVVGLEITKAGTWVYDFDSWRVVEGAKLDVPDESDNLQNKNSLSDCNDTCIDSGDECLSYIYDVDNKNCRIYDTRFGFNDYVFSDDSHYDYYERPVDIVDSMGDLLNQSASQNQADATLYFWEWDYQQFVILFRQPVTGYVNDTGSGSKYDEIVRMENVESAEECATYCVRDRGLMNENTGNRCVSFNYNEDEMYCDLISFSMDDEHSIDGLFTSDWVYYERIVGDGCWIINQGCRKYSDAHSLVGVIGEDTDWEFECMDYARTYHEDICDGYVDEATVAVWGGDGAAVTEIWNSWDFSTGCVMDLTAFVCNASERFEERKFRDSIGEHEFAAAFDKDRCFERAAQWYDYCALEEQPNEDGTTAQLNVSFPSDGSFYIEPLIYCECDAYGMKIESAFGMEKKFCSRDLSYEYCWRTDQLSYWSEVDMLCEDVGPYLQCPQYAGPVPDYGRYSFNEQYQNEGGSNATNFSFVTPSPVDASGSWESKRSQCFLYYAQFTSILEFEIPEYVCKKGGKYKIENKEFSSNMSNAYYYELTCDQIDGCSNDFGASDCEAMAKTIHRSCGNKLSQAGHQIITWYAPTGEIFVYPSFENPFESTLMRAVSTTAAYTAEESDESIYVDFIPIRNGRWQTFTALTTGECRQISVYYFNDMDSANLTMSLYAGDGITQTVKLGSASVDAALTADAEYIHFSIANVELTADTLYTWQVTSISDAPTSLGELGYVRGNGYDDGIGDMAWDYLFVVWIEELLTDNNALLLTETDPSSTRPWFEIWFVMGLVLFFIFFVFLLFLHFKRRHDEKVEKDEDRRFQAELRERAKLQAEAERQQKQQKGDGDDDDDSEDGSDYDESDEKVLDDEEFGDEEYAGNTKKRKAERVSAVPFVRDDKETNYQNVISDEDSPLPDKDEDEYDGYADTTPNEYARVTSATVDGAEPVDTYDDGDGDGDEDGQLTVPQKKKKRKRKKKPKRNK